MNEKKPVGFGLTPQEHGDLNRAEDLYPGGPQAKDKRIAELRKKYAGNVEALKQLDAYESSPQYMDELRDFMNQLIGKEEE